MKVEDSCTCLFGGGHAMAHMWRWRPVEGIFSFYHMGPGV